MNTYERTPHRLDGLDVQAHYKRVAERIGKFSRRLQRIGFVFDKEKDIMVRGESQVTLAYIEEICDFTAEEFGTKYLDKSF